MLNHSSSVHISVCERVRALLNCLSEDCVSLRKTEEGRQKAQQRGKVSFSSLRFLMWPNFPLSITNKPQE